MNDVRSRLFASNLPRMELASFDEAVGTLDTETRAFRSASSAQRFVRELLRPSLNTLRLEKCRRPSSSNALDSDCISRDNAVGAFVAAVGTSDPERDAHRHALDSRTTVLDLHVAELSSRVSELDSHVSKVNSYVSELDSRVSEVNSHVSELNSRPTEVDTRCTKVDLHAIDARIRPPRWMCGRPC